VKDIWICQDIWKGENKSEKNIGAAQEIERQSTNGKAAGSISGFCGFLPLSKKDVC